MTGLVTIVSLLNTITVSEYQETKLISELNNFYNFDHNFFLLDSSADENRHLSRQEGLIPQSVYVFKDIDNNITGLETLEKINGKNTFLIIVSENDKVDSNLRYQVRKMHRLQVNMKIGMFLSPMASYGNLQILFEWCWDNRIINIFVAFYSNSEGSRESVGSLNIFTFNPFGTFDLINCTGSRDIFLSQNSNFQQHPLRLGKLYSRMLDKLLWSAVFSFINASFIYVLDGNNDLNLEIRYVRSNKHEFMYPIMMESEVVVVPEALPYSGFAVYLQNATSVEFFSYSLIGIAVTTIFLIVFRYIKQKKVLFFQSVVDVLNLLMNDNLNIKYQQLSRVEVFLIVPLSFCGFIIVNGILSNLKSYLTRPIPQHQIHSLEDVYMSPFTIFTIDEAWRKFLINELQNQGNHRNWSDKIQVMQTNLLEQQIFTYNTSMSFLWNLFEMKSVLGLQKLLNIRGYHVSQAHIQRLHTTYTVNNTFPFKERLEEIIHRMKSAGLFEQWLQEEASEREKFILKTYLSILKNYNETDIERFPVPMFIVYGWGAGIMLLLIEIIWKKFTFPRKRIISIFSTKFGR